MSCDRCEDIHLAQFSGKNKDPCKCICHNAYSVMYNSLLDTHVYATSDGNSTTNLNNVD